MSLQRRAGPSPTCDSSKHIFAKDGFALSRAFARQNEARQDLKRFESGGAMRFASLRTAGARRAETHGSMSSGAFASAASTTKYTAPGFELGTLCLINQVFPQLNPRNWQNLKHPFPPAVFCCIGSKLRLKPRDSLRPRFQKKISRPLHPEKAVTLRTWAMDGSTVGKTFETRMLLPMKIKKRLDCLWWTRRCCTKPSPKPSTTSIPFLRRKNHHVI